MSHWNYISLQCWVFLNINTFSSSLQWTIFYLLSCWILCIVARQNKGCKAERSWVAKPQDSNAGHGTQFLCVYYRHTLQTSAAWLKTLKKYCQSHICQRHMRFLKKKKNLTMKILLETLKCWIFYKICYMIGKFTCVHCSMLILHPYSSVLIPTDVWSKGNYCYLHVECSESSDWGFGLLHRR